MRVDALDRLSGMRGRIVQEREHIRLQFRRVIHPGTIDGSCRSP
jgi:hypothetical protein